MEFPLNPVQEAARREQACSDRELQAPEVTAMVHNSLDRVLLEGDPCHRQIPKRRPARTHSRLP